MTTSRPWMRAPNFADVVAEAALLTPDRPALIADGAALSFAQLAHRSQAAAGTLRSFGVGRGDVIALGMGNDHRFVECLLGTLRLGATALLLNVKLGDDTIKYVLGHSGAGVVLGGAHGTVPLEEYERLRDHAPPVTSAVTVEPDEPAVLMYTSGSTGVPKGVPLSHSNTWWQARSMARVMLHDRHDRALVMGPLYHANALWCGLFPMLFVGGSVVVLPQFDAAAALAAIEQHRVTYTSGTPSMFTLLLAAQRSTPAVLDSLQLLECGSAPVPPELMTRISDRVGCDVVETYGLSEGGATVVNPRFGVRKPGSAGLPVPDAEIRIVDPDGNDCAVDESGELLTRSPANLVGYLNDPATTAARLDPDGWLSTGDLFRRDEQGYCYFCGRTDDMISVGGENVYPKEVEQLLLKHPDVLDVCVVSARHPAKGAAPVAWVVRRPAAAIDEDGLRRHCLAGGPAYAHPRRVFFLEVLPVNGANKIDRRLLQRRADEALPDGL